MATLQTTYFGDLIVTGNTTLGGNLTVLGSYAYFASNLGAGSDGQSTIGPVANVYVGGSNTTTLNVTTISNGIGIGTSVSSGAALNVLGNVAVSNALQTTVVRVTTANAPGANVTSIYGPSGFVGLNTTGSSGTALYISGNVNVASCVTTPNVFTTALNATVLNTFSFWTTSNLAVGGAPVSSGPVLAVFGNVLVSNAIQTPNVLATTVNVIVANVTTIPGPLGVNGPALAHANLAVYGNVAISNGFTAPIVTFSGAGNVSRIANIASLVVGSNLGVGTGPVPGGPALHVIGNVVVSNTFTVPDTFTSSWNISGFANALTAVASRNFLIGGATGGANVAVSGNVFASNAVQTGTALSTSLNATTLNVTSITGPVGVNVSTGIGATLQIGGNATLSNTLTTANISSTRVNASAVSNVITLVTSNLGVGTAPVLNGPTLRVIGNVVVSNALTTGTVFATSSNGTTLNTASIFGPSGNVGINTTTDFGTDLYVAGNIWASNTLVMPAMSGTLSNLSVANTISIVNWGMGIGTASIDVIRYFQGATQFVQDAPTSNTAILFPNTSGAIVNFGSASTGKVNYATTNTFIEAWVYVPSGSGGGDILTYSNTSAGYSLEMKISTLLKLQFGILASPGGVRTTGENQISADTWTHVAFAISQSAGQIVCWKNGGQNSGQNSKSFTGPVYIATDSLVLGDTLNPSDSFDGYIRDVRIISDGIVPITGSFVPDQAPFSATTPSYVTGGTPTFLLGVLGPRTLVVQGNSFISNTLTTTNVFATTANVTSSGIDFVPGPVGINTTGPSGTTLYVSGNLVASNALTALGAVNVITANVTTGLSLSAPLIVQNLGGTGNSLEVRGNAYVSNEVETTNLTALTSLNTTTLNVLSFSGRTGLNTTQASGTSMYVSGNVYASNTLVTTNTFVSTFNVSRTTNTNTVELATATVRPTPDLVRYLKGAASIATDAPSYSGPALRLTGGASSNPDSAVFGATHPLNFDPNTSNTFIEAFIYLSSTSGSYRTIFTIGDPSVSISSTNQPLLFCIQTYLSLFVKTQTSSAVVQGGGITLGWWHVAAMIDVVNNTISVAYNGTLVTPASITGGPIVTGPLNFSAAIGASQTSGTKYGFPGYISDLRIMRGGTVPSASFTAPTAPGTFSTAAPSYFAGGLTVFTLSDYMTPRLGATLTVGGNVIASNAVTSTNLNTISTTNVSVLANASVVSSVSAAIVRGSYANVALGTAANVVVSNGLTVSNIFGTRINAATLNTSSLFGNVGVNAPTDQGTGLFINGNLYMSNVTTAVPNVYGTTSVNASTQVNTASIFGPSGFVGINTTGASGTTLYVQGNLYMSNVTTAVPNVYGTTSVNASTRVNTASIFGPSGNVSFGIQGDFSTTLYVQGNLYASNALGTSELDAITANITTTNVSSIFSPNSNVGIGTNDPSGTRLYVQGNLYASNALSTPTILTPTANATTVANVLEIDVGIGVGTSTTSGTNLYVLGNLYASNTLAAPSLRVTAGNVTTTNVSSIVGLSGKVGVNTTAPSGTDLYVGGNLYASNTLAAPNLRVTTGNVTTTNVSAILGPSMFVGIHTTAPSGTTLYVNGNIFISNALSTPNVFTTNINASSTFNATTLVTQYVNAAALGWSNTNIFVANSITTTNVFATKVNASGYWSTSGFVGVDTTDASGTTLYVDGNVAAANVFLNVPSVLGDPWIYYNEDVTKRYPHLLPTPSNAASIQNWISTTCNAASQPTEGWWSSSPRVTTGNIVYTGTALTDTWSHPLLLPDGRLMIVPQDYSNVGFFNPFTNELSKVPVTSMPTGTSKWRSGVLTPNGNVVLAPYAQSNVGVFNPISYQYSNIAAGLKSTGTIWFQGAVLAPNGNVICVPRDSPNICVVDPTTFTASNVGPIAADALDLFGTGVLLPNGNVVFAPLGSANIGMFNPSTRTYSNVGPIKSTGTGSSLESACLAPDGNIIMVPYNSGNAVVYNPSYVSSPLSPGAFSNIIVGSTGGSKFNGAVLAPTGNIICMPYSSDNVGMIDPVALTFSNVVPYNGAVVCRRGVLIPDGRIIAPRNEANVIYAIGGLGPVSTEFCLSPYLNKW